MTREEAIAELSNILPQTPALRLAIDSLKAYSTIKEAYDRGYKDGQEALVFHLELCKEEAEPCEDCISRKAVIDYIKDCTVDLGYVNGTNMVLDVISNMPSIQPKPKTDLLDKIRADRDRLQESIKALGEDIRICQKSITDKKVLIGFNMAVALCNKHLAESEDKE